MIRKHQKTSAAQMSRQASDFTAAVKHCMFPRTHFGFLEMLILHSLDAYYLLIHPCFPVLPPPPSKSTEHDSAAHETDIARSESPLVHAVATLLALVPKKAEHAHAARHDCAEHYSELAVRAIDRDMDASGPWRGADSTKTCLSILKALSRVF